MSTLLKDPAVRKLLTVEAMSNGHCTQSYLTFLWKESVSEFELMPTRNLGASLQQFQVLPPSS